MKLTKKFIKENAEMTLKEAFPEVFESDFTGWMISNYNGWVGYFENNILKYGIVHEKWFVSSKITNLKDVNCDIPATPQEIKDALEKESVRRGYGIGVYCKFGTAKTIREIKSDKFNYNKKFNIFTIGSDAILQDGIWAQIIPTITKQEAE